jgi:hypothetical protein
MTYEKLLFYLEGLLMRAVLRLFAVPLGAVLAAACSGTTVADAAVVADTTPFSCGTVMCQAGEYCEIYKPGTSTLPGGGGSYTCISLPAACSSDATCDCVAPTVMMSDATPCASVTCSSDGAGHVTADCGWR